MTQHPPLGGVILAGGQSRRMGMPKAFVRLRPNGPTLIELVLARLATVCAETVIVTNSPEQYAHLGCRLIPDAYPGLGALAGIQAGLAVGHHEHQLVVACDMPFLNPRLLYGMASRPRDYAVLIPRRADGQLEPLHAIYGRAALPAITTQLEGGAGRVTGFLEQVQVVYLDEAECAQYDPGLRSFANLNTPTELNEAQAVVAESLDGDE